MKLNNKGWGYRMMIFLMIILSTFLLVAIYYIYRYYNTIEMRLIYDFFLNGGYLL
ncbi:MAG: hypothetical protein PHS24_01075 [Bacilli bacterium]|nr:hypothetical protein [Bacilli bacterium]